MVANLDQISLKGAIAPTLLDGKGGRVDPLLSSAFTVTIAGIGYDYEIPDAGAAYIGFSKVSGIGSSIQTTPIRQGTSPVTAYTPTGIQYTDVKLEVGVATHKVALAVMKWYRDTKGLMFSTDPRSLDTRSEKAKILAGDDPFGQPEPTADEALSLVFRRVKIEVPVRLALKTGMPLIVTLIDAWPVAASFGDLNAKTSKVWIHSLTLKYSGIQVEVFNV